MAVLESEICNCITTGGSSERNEKGQITHGLIQGGCGKIRRTVVFWCGLCEELSTSTEVDYVRQNNVEIYYCDPCRKYLNDS